jgi:hypothetical protein
MAKIKKNETQMETTKIRISNLEGKEELFAPMSYDLVDVLPPMQTLESELKHNQERLLK